MSNLMCLASVDFSNLVCAFLSTIKRVQKLHKIRLGINSFIIRNMSESQAARLFPLVMLLDDADYFTITPGNCRIHSTTIRIDKNIKKAFCYCLFHSCYETLQVSAGGCVGGCSTTAM